MANSARFRSGQQHLVTYGVASATVIERGDMLYFDTTNHVVKPASDFTWDTDLATTQGSFAAVFVGIAVESSASGSTADISVDVSNDSVYEMDCPSSSFQLDESVGPDDSGSDTLMDQTVELAVAAASIARVVETTSSSTTVRVRFASAYAPVNANNQVG